MREYAPADHVSGTLLAVGANPMLNSVRLWKEGFCKLHPGTSVDIEGTGATTGPHALIDGKATFGLTVRPFIDEELKLFQDAYGYPPTLLVTSLDMLVVVVHRDNPVEALSLPQLNAIFSSTRRLGAAADITRWGQIGLKGEWASRRISLHGRNEASQHHQYFRQRILDRGELKEMVKAHARSAAVLEALKTDRGGIGYVGIGALPQGTRVLALAPAEGDKPIPADLESAWNGKYPLARFHYLALNHKPGTDLDPVRREFIRYVFSRQGQEAVVKDGLVPVNATVAREQLRKLGLGESPE